MNNSISPKAKALIELLRLKNVSSASVDEKAVVGDWVVKIWVERGYEVGKVGCVSVRFPFNPKTYIYPLHLVRR